jgi:hypothetical protein
MHQAAVDHRMLWWKEVCYPCAAMQAPAVVTQNALVRSVSLRCHAKLAVVMITECLVEGRVCYPADASSLLL